MPYPSLYRPAPRKGKRKGSEHISGKRRSWLEEAKPKVTFEVKKEARLDASGIRFGHDNPALRAFMHDNRRNFVPIRQWGGKSHVNV